MKLIWNAVNKLNLYEKEKNYLFLLGSFILYGLIGFIIWTLIQFFVLSELEWMFCFIGYPAIFIGFAGGILYLYEHSF